MSDEALRALERDARARPDDRAATWAYARGLERAGERRALWLELCRMARAGDDDASRAVDAWVPGLGGTTPPVLASLRAPKVERVSLVRDEAFLNDRVDVVVVAPEDRVLLLAGQTLVAAIPRAEAVEWRQASVAALGSCGDDALVLTRERSAFLHRAGGAERSVGAGLVGSDVVEIGAVHGDRMLVLSRQLLQAFEVGAAFGRVLWKQSVRGVVAVTGDVALIVREDESEARELESGLVLWERSAAENDGFAHVWWDHDRTSVLFHTWVERGARTTSVDLRTGAQRWCVAQECSERSVALTPALFVVERDERHLAAHARDDGRLVWTADLPPSDTTLAYTTGADALYLALAVGEELRLRVFDLVSGRVRATAVARLPGDGTVCAVWVREGAVEVLVAIRGDLVLIVRFAD